MINGDDFYDILEAFVPLYVALATGYASVRWWKIFTAEQCSGISRFVAHFAMPLLSFKLISSSDPYAMNFKFIAADLLQKLSVLIVLFVWKSLSSKGSLEWVITLFSLACVPNTLVIGLPLLKAMYGDLSTSLVFQIMVCQGVLWRTVLLVMFEYRGAMLFTAQQFENSAVGSITSFRLDSDVISLNPHDPSLQANAEILSKGELHMTVRKSTASSTVDEYHHAVDTQSQTVPTNHPIAVEIYSLPSSKELASSRASSFGKIDLQANGNSRAGTQRTESATSSLTDLDDKVRNAEMRSLERSRASLNKDQQPHMFMWSSNTSAGASHPMSSRDNLVIGDGKNNTSTVSSDSGMVMIKPTCRISAIQPQNSSSKVLASYAGQKLEEREEESRAQTQVPPVMIMSKFMLIIVWRKLIRNSNTYASVFALAWSLVSFRWDTKMPKIIQGSILLLSNTGLGLALFSIGQFTALQPKIISCGKHMLVLSTAFKFVIGPAVMAATSAFLGLHGVLLQIAIVQAALPPALISFVLAQEYHVHVDLLSTSVILGMVLALPISLLYHVILAL